jgi:hypothetical protein
MNREIKNIVDKVLNEELNARTKSVKRRLFENKETCEQCGGNMVEGETCEQCGNMGEGDIQELGGMDDSHPFFGGKNLRDIPKEDIERFFRNREEDEEYKDRSMYDPYYGDDDEEEYYPELRMPRDMPSYKTKYRYSDDEEEITEKLHGKQRKLDKNKNNRIDSEDFKMLRKQQDETEQLYEVEFEKEVGEGETDESKEFSYAAMMAKKKGKKTFELDGETFDVKESYMRKKLKAKVNESILFTETDLIDFIEKIVNEDKKFRKSEPKGYKEYEKVHKADKKENDDYLKSVAKKMTDYLKGASDDGSKYEMKKTKKFPTENGGLKKNNRKKYTPSDAVDDYIDAFNYGSGQTGLRFDEIKPNDKNIEKYLKGDSTTGNAQVDKDGNALGNVVPSKVGDKFYNMYKDNLFGQEQAEASYKRQPQPVDQAGEHTERGSLKTKRGKKTSQSVLNKLEENVNEKESKKLNEEFDRIQNLMGYNRKTQ